MCEMNEKLFFFSVFKLQKNSFLLVSPTNGIWSTQRKKRREGKKSVVAQFCRRFGDSQAEIMLEIYSFGVLEAFVCYLIGIHLIAFKLKAREVSSAKLICITKLSVNYSPSTELFPFPSFYKTIVES
jgi:hypothetical protein